MAGRYPRKLKTEWALVKNYVNPETLDDLVHSPSHRHGELSHTPQPGSTTSLLPPFLEAQLRPFNISVYDRDDSTGHSLPWQELKVADRIQKDKLALERKKTMSVEELCDRLPMEFAHYFHHVRFLGFGDKPSYTHLRKIFRDLFARERFEHDNVFDWTIWLFFTAGNGSNKNKIKR